MSALTKKVGRLTGMDKHPGHGGWDEASSNWVDGKPYVGYTRQGLFVGYDDSLWKYYVLPEDVQINWLSRPEQVIENQHFFVDMCRELGEMINDPTEKVRNDVRRDFHISITQTPSEVIVPPKSTTPAQADFLRRFSLPITKPQWHGMIGVKLLPGSIFYEHHGFSAQVRRYVEAITNPDALQLAYYAQDNDAMDSLMARNGFTTADFIAHPEQLEQLTAWHGVEDVTYGLPRQLQNIRVQEPVQGLSLITPKWGEVTFHAIKPHEHFNISDPLMETSRWAVPLYHPSQNVVAINIRGQVRSTRTSENLLDIKRMSKERAVDDSDSLSQVRLIAAAQQVVEGAKLPVLDNVEIIVASKVPQDGTAHPLPAAMRPYGLQAAPMVGRQHLALLTTFPTYPRHVARVPRGSRKRPDLVNVMLPGVLAMSGVFRSTKPCALDGVLLGLGDASYQFPEIYTQTDGHYANNRVPGMLVTGRPGAGKTVQLLMITQQIAKMGLPSVFLNPKKVGTLKPTFDAINGITISMSRAYLEKNPGQLDPVNFISERATVATMLGNAIFRANQMSSETGPKAAQFRAQIQAELIDNAADLRNTCSGDIIFGNGDSDSPTPALSDPDLLQFVRNKISTAPFWRAFIGLAATRSDLAEKMSNGRSVLVEWDGSMALPSLDKAEEKYTDPEMDMVLSVTTVFAYAAAYVGGTGGAVTVDESWVLKNSAEAKGLLTQAGREWRQANIMLIMATQNITDWLGATSGVIGQSGLDSFFDRFLFMAINEAADDELDAFFKYSGLPRTPYNENYIRNAGVDQRRSGGRKGRAIPAAYYVDRVHDWAGGMICGPWPAKELAEARTDKAGEAARAASEQVEHSEKVDSSTYGGSLGVVLDDVASFDADAEAAPVGPAFAGAGEGSGR